MSTVQDNERSLALRRPQRTVMRFLFDEMDRTMGNSWGWPLRIRPFPKGTAQEPRRIQIEVK